MNFIIGIRTEEFVVIVADKTVFAHGAINISNEQSKEIKLGEKLYMAIHGEGGDVADFGNWAQANLRLYNTRHGYELNPRSTHHWLRQSIAKNLRNENYWQVNLLVAGYDDLVEKKPFLGMIDYLGNSIPDQNYLFLGFPGKFCYAILDALYKERMSEKEVLEIIGKCLLECKKRVIVNLPKFTVLVIDKNGTRHLPDVLV